MRHSCWAHRLFEEGCELQGVAQFKSSCCTATLPVYNLDGSYSSIVMQAFPMTHGQMGGNVNALSWMLDEANAAGVPASIHDKSIEYTIGLENSLGVADLVW